MESIEPIRKPSGCLKASGRFGCFMAICSVLFIVFCIWMTISSEEHMNELRDEYAASSQEYEDALAAYNADSAHLNAEFNRISARIDEANAKGDTVLAAQLRRQHRRCFLCRLRRLRPCSAHGWHHSLPRLPLSQAPVSTLHDVVDRHL